MWRQIGVFLGYASRHGRALIDRALYLPQTWTKDRPRCRDAGIPDEVAFATKPQIARAMLERAFLAHVPYAWVAGDSVYGADSALRRAIAAAGKGYGLPVTSAQHLGLRPVGDWAKEAPKGGWTRLSAGDGAKGPRLYDWACVPFRGAREGWQKALLIRRSLEKPDELTFYLTLAPESTERATLVQVAGTRWTIEACFEAAKGEVGLDEYEVRSWTGWHRHVTLALLAHAYLAVVRQPAIRGRGPRPRGRRAAPYGSRGAPAPLASRLGKAARPRSQGHSKKALGGEEDGIETVLGQGLANGRERSRQRPRQAQDRVAQRCQRLRGAAGTHSAGVLAQAHVPAPVQLVLNRPMPAHKRQQRLRAGLLAGEARDGIRYLAAGLALDLPLPLDAAHLGHARPIEMGHNLAACGDAARLEAPVPFLDGASLLKVRRRAVPEGITGGLLAQSLDQLRGERRRRMRGRCRP